MPAHFSKTNSKSLAAPWLHIVRNVACLNVFENEMCLISTLLGLYVVVLIGPITGFVSSPVCPFVRPSVLQKLIT